MVCRLTLSYRGTAYAGWQRQSNALAIQQVVEEALAKVLGEPIRIHGAGRTDAGVHAHGQIAHLRLPRTFPYRGLVLATNHHLPLDIRLLAAHRMPANFNARKSALGKEYIYRLYRGRAAPAPVEPFVALAPRQLDVAAMRRATARLVGRHDFTAFALAGGSHGQPFRRLFAVTVDEVGREVRLSFLGDGFLRGMVRSLVGSIVLVGRGTQQPGWIDHLLSGQPRTAAGPTAPAQGLSLEQVFYHRRWAPLDGWQA